MKYHAAFFQFSILNLKEFTLKKFTSRKLFMWIYFSGTKVIDSIIITYDDDSVWSYGMGGGKSHGKTIIFAKNEYLVSPSDTISIKIQNALKLQHPQVRDRDHSPFRKPIRVRESAKPRLFESPVMFLIIK